MMTRLQCGIPLQNHCLCYISTNMVNYVVVVGFPDQCPCDHHGCRAGVCHPTKYYRETALWPGEHDWQMSTGYCFPKFLNDVRLVLMVTRDFPAFNSILCHRNISCQPFPFMKVPVRIQIEMCVWLSGGEDGGTTGGLVLRPAVCGQ